MNTTGSDALSPRRAGALLLAAVILVAANLRMTITAVGPLLDEISADEGVSPAVLGLLGALPLVCWGVVSPLSHGLSARIGMTSAVSWSLVAIGLGTALRSLPGLAVNLWLGTALIGCGLAVANVLMPAVIKRDFAARVPLVMGIYTALLSGAGALGAGIAVPLSQVNGVNGEPAGWRFALLIMGAPLPVALILWLLANRRRTRASLPVSPSRPFDDAAPYLANQSSGRGRNPSKIGARIWRDRLAWQVSLYMGAQSSIFYTLSSWYVPYEIARGVPAASAGAQLMTFQLLGIAGSLLFPLFGRHLRLRRWLPAVLPTIGLCAWFGIPLAPQFMPVWIFIGGLIGGAQLTASMMLMATRARTSDHSAALSGMAQSVGYLIAAIGPLFFGVLLDATGNWIAPFMLIWIAASGQLVLGLFVGRGRFIFDR